jgi:hypothetical protein
MNRYFIVYTFLAIIMAALVILIGMPWTSHRRKFAWSRTRKKDRLRR